ncbi:MAG: nucleotidyltransferase domain-containing protein [Candidatus Bathyarchaeia archaeon]
MKKYPRENYYNAVNELIKVITERYGTNLKAIYAGGSFARGDFVPGRSDIDIYVVVSDGKEELQKDLQGEALSIEKRYFRKLKSVLDEVLGVTVTTLREIQEGRSFLGAGSEYSNFIKEGKLLWGEDIRKKSFVSGVDGVVSWENL